MGSFSHVLTIVLSLLNVMPWNPDNELSPCSKTRTSILDGHLIPAPSTFSNKSFLLDGINPLLLSAKNSQQKNSQQKNQVVFLRMTLGSLSPSKCTVLVEDARAVHIIPNPLFDAQVDFQHVTKTFGQVASVENAMEVNLQENMVACPCL